LKRATDPSSERINCPTQPGRLGVRQGTTDLAQLLKRIPDGWTLVMYERRHYGLTRTTRVHGRSISIFAEELGGPDLISANVYRTRQAEHLRPCEMPDAKVLAFLRGWAPILDTSDDQNALRRIYPTLTAVAALTTAEGDPAAP
jgi:hypothetical protein